MRARLFALAAVALIIFLPLQPNWAATDESNRSNNPKEIDLPAALSEDDSFNDLPFEQLRQALREEVEPNPNRSAPPRSYKQYDLLIR